MSEIMDLVVIREKNAMAVFTTTTSSTRLSKHDRKSSQPGAGHATTKRPLTLSHPMAPGSRALKPTSTTGKDRR